MVDFTKLFEKKVEQDQALKDYIARLPVNAVDPETGFTNYTNPAIPESKLPVEGVHNTYIPTQRDIKGPIQFLPAVQQGNENVKHIIKEGADFNRLFGTNGAERVHTWPEKMVRSGYTLPTDVMEGRVLTGVGLRPGDYSDDPNAPHPLAELIERGQDLAGMAAGGSIASTGLKAEAPGALSRLATKLKERLNEDNEVGTGLAALSKSWEDKGVRNTAIIQSEKAGGNIKLHDISIPKEQRNQGIGSQYMQDLIKFADENDKTIVLTAAKDLGSTSLERLKNFYKEAGFVENKGRNKDFKISENMYRRPVGLAEDSEVGTALSATKNSFANRLNEHINGNQSMPEILAKQRASEGYEAAIRDSETKKVTTGMWHEEVIDKIAKERGIPREEVNMLVSSPAKGNLVKGYVNDRGQFLSEAALERRQQARTNSKTAMFRSDDEVGTAIASLKDNYLYHGTTRDAAKEIDMNGIEPKIGSFVKRMYGEDATDELVHLADRNNIKNAINAMKVQIAEKLNKTQHEVTNADIEKHGVLYGVKKHEYNHYKATEEGHARNSRNEIVEDVPIGVENDWYSRDTVNPDKKITGKQLVSLLKSNKLMSDDLAGTAVAGAANSMAPKFYSALERSVSNSKSNKASPEQWLGPRTERTYTDKNTGKEVHEVKYSGMLGNTPGITVEEIEHLRLPEWIDAQKQAGKKSISKEEIQNYINENKVEMNEKWTGKLDAFEYDKLNRREQELIAKGGDATQAEKQEWADIKNKLNIGDPRFAQYQLPGGTNYRELLLNLKDNPAKVKRIEEVKNRVEQINNEISDIQKQLRNPGDWKINNYEEMKQKSNEFKERQANLATERFKIEHELTSNNFEHSHWPGEKNTLVHARMNDRFIPDENSPSVNPVQRTKSAQDLVKEWGYTNEQWKNLTQEQRNKILNEHENDLSPKGLNSLHVEEIQSDLHQQGNSEGYKLSADLKKKLEPEFNRIEEKIITTTEDARKKVVDAFKSKKDQTEITKLQTEALELEKSIIGNPDLNDAIKNAIDRKVITPEEGRVYKRYSDSERQGAVMDAPFKDKWSDVMIKRLIRQAVEENKDSISWTPGQAQVDRYPGLEKHLSEVYYNKTKGILTGYDKDGKVVIAEQNVTPDKLTGMIGKEPTDKLLKNKETLTPEKSLKSLKIRSSNDGGGGYEIINDEGTVIHHTPTRKSAEQWVNWEGKQNDINLKHESYRIKGEDLKIGGEFHKKFYDEIMLNKVNAIAKKFGGRIEEKEIPVTSKNLFSGEQVMDDLGIARNEQKSYWENLTQEKRNELFDKYVEKKSKQKIWVLRLTPELKKHSLEKGFSLFESGLPIVPVDHDPWQDKKKLKLTPVSHNPFQ